MENPSHSKASMPSGSGSFFIEHALGMYAHSYSVVPAESIYDDVKLAPMMSVIQSCHIYLIGFLPLVEFVGAYASDGKLNMKFKISSKAYTVSYDIPEGLSFKKTDGLYYLEDGTGRRYWPNMQGVQTRLSSESKAVNFEVKYIGQAFGTDGSRNALDRLRKHETLQKISLKGVPVGQRLSLLLLAIQPNNQLFTVFNPFASNKDKEDERIEAGLDKLFNTTEQERISLYEASLIRYFKPEFNIEFKNSFPSTNMKILQDCYAKDFGAVIAEICIDELPFQLFSNEVKPAPYHIAQHDLHQEDDRKFFFGR